MGERVRITDVSPRDGLQNEPGVIAARDKARLVELVAASGVDEIEVTSFVSARWVPQLGDAAEVFGLLDVEESQRPVLSALVPNEKGMLAAIGVIERAERDGREPPIDKVAVFTAASETFCRKNINASIGESIERFRPVVEMAGEHGLDVRGYVSCAIACPFEGPVEAERAAEVALMLLDIGVDEIDYGDTIGAGDAERVRRLIGAHVAMCGAEQLEEFGTTLHLHDTFGRAGECIRAALEMGVRSFDGAVAGLGGCPYASTPQRRAPGNVSTELVARVAGEMGFETGVDFEALEQAAAFARRIVGGVR